MTMIDDGSDLGGSIRIPAACCSVLGYKAPYGRNPNTAITSFDHTSTMGHWRVPWPTSR